jgi:predicted Fe-S protein YdhL (DUF1289 family)
MKEAQYWFRLSEEERAKVWSELSGRMEAMERGEMGGFRRGPYEE